jgi:hypothetical protein
MSALQTLAIALLVVGIVATMVEGVRRGSGAVIVNTVAALGVTLVPPAVLLPLDVATSTQVGELTLWIAAASFLHSLGMLGLYESVAWWDHLTHTLSAGVLAAVFYAASIVAIPPKLGAERALAVAGVTVALTLAMGVAWELIELVARELGKRYDIEPVLVHYGRRDTALDLLFDTVGAVVVLTADVRVFLPIIERFPEAASVVLAGSAVGCVVGIGVATSAVIALRRIG